MLAPGPALAADDYKVTAIVQVETRAKKIPDGKISESARETIKGIGNGFRKGAKYSGEELRETWKAAEPPAKTA